MNRRQVSCRGPLQRQGRDPWRLITKPRVVGATKKLGTCPYHDRSARIVAAGDDRPPLYATPAIQQVTMATEYAHRHQQLAGATRHVRPSPGRNRSVAGGT